MKFLKNNSYDIVRFFIFQIGITIFSMLLYTAIGVLEDASTQLLVKLVISLLSIVFYLALVYTVSWDYGAKDRIRAEGGKIQFDKLKGAKLALFANVPNFILALASIVFILLYMLQLGEGWYAAFGISTMILRLLASMYIGVLQAIFASFDNNVTISYLLQTVGFLLLPMLTVLASHVGYSFGDKNLKIFAFGGKSKKNK